LVHEEISADGDIGKLKNHLNHYSYKGLDFLINKRNRYAQLQAQALYNKNKKPNLYHFLIKPFVRFLKHYLIGLGFLDGMRGFIISCIYAYGVFMRYVKLWMLHRKLK
jgi:hypothetical protein